MVIFSIYLISFQVKFYYLTATWVGLKATTPLLHKNISIPKFELPDLSQTSQRPVTNEVLQASSFMNMTSRLLDRARNPLNLCCISIILAWLVTISLPTSITIAAGIGLVSGIGFYALGRHSILPTRENAMQPCDSFLGSYRIG